MNEYLLVVGFYTYLSLPDLYCPELYYTMLHFCCKSAVLIDAVLVEDQRL